MIKERFPTYNLIWSILFILLIPDLYAQSDNANDNADNNNGGGTDPFALTVTASGPESLNFGAFVNVNGGNIVIDPFLPNNGPIADPTGFVMVKNGSGPLLFEVSNQATPFKVVNLNYAVTPLSNGSSNLGLTVKFNSSRPLTGNPTSYTFTINQSNPATIYMGGTLTVAPEALPGTYTGNVSVTIDYP